MRIVEDSNLKPKGRRVVWTVHTDVSERIIGPYGVYEPGHRGRCREEVGVTAGSGVVSVKRRIRN